MPGSILGVSRTVQIYKIYKILYYVNERLTKETLTGGQEHVKPCAELMFMEQTPPLWHGLDKHKSTIDSQ